MRKISTLLMLFCAFVGAAFAQIPAPNKSYTISTAERGGLAANNAATACVGYNHTAVADEAQKNFAFVQYDGKVYLYNVWAEKFMEKDGSLSATLPIDDITIEYLEGDDKYFFKFDDSRNVNLGGSSQLTIDGWNTKDAGNLFTLVEVADFDPTAALAILDNSYTITYKFVYNEKEVASQTAKVTKGANYPAVDSNLLPWGATVSIPDGAPAGNETITLNCTVDTSVLPFEAADSYNDANMKWYCLQFHASFKHCLYFNAADEVLLTDKTSYDENDKDAYSWAFVGNPFDGYTIYNRKAYAQNANLKLNATEAGATLGTADHKFKPTQSPYGTKGFYLASPNGANTQRFNRQNGQVVYWTGADAGSTFMAVDADEKLLLDALTQLSTMVNNAKAELMNKHKLPLQTTDANAPFYLSATDEGDAPISAAIDNDPATHYGSTWGHEVGHHHYWQVDLADASNLEVLEFSYITRANGNDTPTKINIQGSTDGEAFTDIMVLEDGLPTAGGSKCVGVFSNDGYRYIRFEVPSTTNNFSQPGKPEQEVTISIAEFSLFDANVDNYSAGDKNMSIAISAADAVLYASNNTLKTVQDAIDAFNAALASWHCTVNYSFTYGGVERYTQAVETYVGEEYPEITVANQFVYGITAVKPTGVINADEVVDGKVTKVIELVVNLPFVPAADYESITKWYYLSIGNNANLLYHEEGADHIALNNTDVDANNKDAYTWAFIGNPFDGFKIVNRATGDGYILSSSTNTFDGNTGGSTYPIMTAEPVGDGNNTYWVAIASPNRGGEGSFYLAQKDVNDGKNKMNNRGGKLAYWNGGADAGSTFKATERDMSGAVELQAYITQVEAFVAAGVTDGTTVGYITSESVANVAAVLAAAKTAVETKVGCNEAQIALQNAIAAVETVQPDVNAYYVIKSAMPEADARSGQMIYVNKQGWMHFHNENVMANVFQFASAGDGKFYLNHVETGSALSTAKGHGGGQEAAHTALWDVNPVAVTITNMGSKNIVKIVPEGGAMIHAQADYSAVVGWDNNSYEGASAWIIEEVNIEDYAHNVTVTAAEWATLVLGYNAAIPEGVTAYAVSSVDAESATLTEVEGVLPANTPVLLNAPANDYAFVLSTETPAVVENNVLDGCTIDREVWEDCYVLGNGSAGVGFYKAKKNVNANTENDIVEGEGEDAVTTPTYEAVLSNAFKAFLVAPTNAQALRFNFGGTTAIESVVNGINANAAIYDLSGRRVEKATKGIYIVNGKKMIVK